MTISGGSPSAVRDGCSSRCLFFRWRSRGTATGALQDGSFDPSWTTQRFVDISQPAVSQHIAVLRKAGLLSQRRMGRSTLYRADPRALAPLIDWIARQDRFWRTALLRLDHTLKETKD